MKNNTQKSPKYFRHLESGEIYFEGLDQKRKLNLINQKTSSEYYLPGQYGEHDYFPFEEIPQPPAPIKEDANNEFTLLINEGSEDEQITTLAAYIGAFDEDLEADFMPVVNLVVGQSCQYGADTIKRIEGSSTLLKENEQLKAEIERLRKWAVETIDISQNLAHKREEQVNVLREALQLLTNSTNLSKLNIRKDFTLINAHANGLKALKKTETN